MSSRSLLGFLYTANSLKQLGIPVDDALQDHGVSLEHLDATGFISRTQELHLYNSLANFINQPGLGMATADGFGLAGYGAFSLMLMTSRHALHAVQLGMECQEVTYLFGDLSLSLAPGKACLEVHPYHLPDATRDFLVERDMAGMHKLLTDMAGIIGQTLEVTGVKLALPPPADPKPYEVYFQCPVSFGHDHSELEVNSQNMMAPFPQANAMACALYHKQCLAQMQVQQGFGSSITEQIRQYLALFQLRFPSVKETAKQIGLPERTLRRRLMQEGLGYQGILDDVRNRKAQHLLGHTLTPIDEIAHLLGYSESAAFIHAFSRWNQQSPSQYRKRSEQSSTR